MRLCADFSHFCCVAETLLEDQQHNLDKVIPTIDHIHARVGHAQAPQVTDFEAPEFKTALDTHISWWQSIVDCAAKRGEKRMTITTEFGPAPYLPTLPHTNMPVSEQWKLNTKLKKLLKQRLNC